MNNYRITDPEKYNLAMNQLLDTKEYGLGYLDDRSKSLNKASNMNNVRDNNKDMGMGDNTTKITDINKSMEMSGGAGYEQK